MEIEQKVKKGRGMGELGNKVGKAGEGRNGRIAE